MWHQLLQGCNKNVVKSYLNKPQRRMPEAEEQEPYTSRVTSRCDFNMLMPDAKAKELFTLHM